MAKPEWGTKRTGPCGTKFYDFNKRPIICPSCGGEVITNEVKTKSKKNDIDKNITSNSEEQALSKDKSNDTVLDSDILDEDISLDEVEKEIEENISDDDINLIDGENDIVLDVEIDEDDK